MGSAGLATAAGKGLVLTEGESQCGNVLFLFLFFYI